MNFLRNIFLLILMCLSLASCLITKSVCTTQIEIMKPGIFGIPKDLTVALINRDLFLSDTCMFTYFNGFKEMKDTTVKYRTLSDTCMNALARYLEKEGYCRKVINYGKSLNSLFKDSVFIGNSPELYERTQSDVCIFLDFLHFNTAYFNLSATPLHIDASLLWTIAIKNDSLQYGYKQIDTLDYDETQVIPNHFNDSPPIKNLYNSCQYLGQFFGTKAIPSWIQVDRLYYKSNNLDMRHAEKFALNNDWLKAAEIWNKETKIKNPRIAAKACFNMALACEMETKLDAAIDWLNKSYTILPQNNLVNLEHRRNCLRYANILSTRKKEIERLSKQLSQKIKD